MLKRTPLFEAHQRLGGKLIEFGGWEMPVYYTSIVDEHQAVRTAAGIFDISHMVQILVEGEAAEAFLNTTLTNDVRKLTPGTGQYTLMCNEQGGVVDDLYCYRLQAGWITQTTYKLIVNASRAEADLEWLRGRLGGFAAADKVRLTNISTQRGACAIALQGPRSAEFIGRVFKPLPDSGTAGAPSDLKKNEIGCWGVANGACWIARTGYTGEDGFELLMPATSVESVWQRLLAEGASVGCKPCGLGARDTLRTEMGYPLYGHELDEQTTPIEAGLSFFVSLDKGEFVGRDVLAKQKMDGIARKCVAFKMTGKSAPPRPGYPVWSAGADAKPVGNVVSGTQSPSLGIGIGMAYVPPEFARPDTAIEIEIRGRRFPAVSARKPLYRGNSQSGS